MANSHMGIGHSGHIVIRDQTLEFGILLLEFE